MSIHTHKTENSWSIKLVGPRTSYFSARQALLLFFFIPELVELSQRTGKYKLHYSEVQGGVYGPTQHYNIN